MPLIHLFLNNFYDEFLISRTFISLNTTYRPGAALVCIILLWEISQNLEQNSLYFDKVQLQYSTDETPVQILYCEYCEVGTFDLVETMQF